MRGSAEIPIMKGFESGFVVKENDGHESDTMPPDPGADVTDKTDSDFEEAGTTKPAANVKAGDNKPGAASTTMSDDVAEVADEAEANIDDGYVQDIQGEKVSDGGEVEKGWEAYNEKCASGVVVKDYGLNKHNVSDAYTQMQESVHSEFVEKAGKAFIRGAAKRLGGPRVTIGGARKPKVPKKRTTNPWSDKHLMSDKKLGGSKKTLAQAQIAKNTAKPGKGGLSRRAKIALGVGGAAALGAAGGYAYSKKKENKGVEDGEIVTKRMSYSSATRTANALAKGRKAASRAAKSAPKSKPKTKFSDRPGVKKARGYAKTAGAIAGPPAAIIGGAAGVGTGVGAGYGAYHAPKGKKLRGAKAGAKQIWTPINDPENAWGAIKEAGKRGHAVTDAPVKKPKPRWKKY